MQELISGNAPDVVVHAAANTNVDGCELEPDNAYRVNALGSRNVAVAAPRPAYSALDHYCIRLEGLPDLRPWEEALEEYLQDEKLKDKLGVYRLMIEGVQVKKLVKHCDDRGFFMEILRDDDGLLSRFGQASMSKLKHFTTMNTRTTCGFSRPAMPR